MPKNGRVVTAGSGWPASVTFFASPACRCEAKSMYCGAVGIGRRRVLVSLGWKDWLKRGRTKGANSRPCLNSLALEKHALGSPPCLNFGTHTHTRSSSNKPPKTDHITLAHRLEPLVVKVDVGERSKQAVQHERVHLQPYAHANRKVI